MQNIREKKVLWVMRLLNVTTQWVYIDRTCYIIYIEGPSWPWSYGSCFLCNQCISPLMLWVWISIRARCATLCDKVCQWLATCRWFSPSPSVSSTNNIYRHDRAEILLKVALNTIKQTNKQTNQMCNNNVTDFKFQHSILNFKFKYLPSINNSDF